MLSLFVAVALSAVSSSSALGADNEGAFLDRPYKNLVHPLVIDSPFMDAQPLAARHSDTAAVIAQQTRVKSQANRGTCSIFSGTALLESMLAIKSGFDPGATDLSEEWLEYLAMRGATDDGSSSDANFSLLAQYGTVREKTLPYIGEEWEDLNAPGAKDACGHLKGTTLKSCLLGHRDPRLLKASQASLLDKQGELYDPEFYDIRQEARAFKKQYLQGLSRTTPVLTSGQAKTLLRQGIPLTLDLDFYYGAWNHREADELGIGRSTEHFGLGLVGYPEVGSADRKLSKKSPAGHSIVVVGYDDAAEFTTRVKMTDGTTKEFTYRGVYYFKNSWGTDKFGKNFEVAGEKHPGYGAITQKYAHEFGELFSLPVEAPAAPAAE